MAGSRVRPMSHNVAAVLRAGSPLDSVGRMRLHSQASSAMERNVVRALVLPLHEDRLPLFSGEQKGTFGGLFHPWGQKIGFRCGGGSGGPRWAFCKGRVYFTYHCSVTVRF